MAQLLPDLFLQVTRDRQEAVSLAVDRHYHPDDALKVGSTAALARVLQLAKNQPELVNDIECGLMAYQVSHQLLFRLETAVNGTLNASFAHDLEVCLLYGLLAGP